MSALIDFGDGIKARVVPGAQAAVLWVHGFTIDSSVWSALWELLPNRTHIGIDLPGHGASAPMQDGCDLAALADTLACAAARYGVRHVVGLSLGSMIALQIAAQHPQRYATLTLGAPARAGGEGDPAAALRYRQLVSLYQQRGAGPWMTELWMSSPPAIFTWAQARPALWAQLREVIDRHTWKELVAHDLARLACYPQSLAQIKQIEARTLLLIGQHEMAAFRNTASLLHDVIPGSTLHELPHVGHLCMLEAPAASAAAMASLFASMPVA